MAPAKSDSTLPLKLAAILVVCIAGGFALGVYLQRHWGPPAHEYRAVEVARADPESNAPAAHFGAHVPIPQEQTAEPENAPSSIDMIRAGSMKGAMPPGQAVRNKTGAAASFTAQVRQNESRYERLALAYTRKYAAIREYGRDWYNSPDLRQYNLDYLKDRDPIRFAFRVAASPNFGALVKKYGAKPEIRQFMMDAIKETPGQLADAASAYLNQDDKASAVVRNFSRALGLPENLFASAASGRPAQMKALKTEQDFREFVQQGNYDSKQFNSSSPQSR